MPLRAGASWEREQVAEHRREADAAMRAFTWEPPAEGRTELAEHLAGSLDRLNASAAIQLGAVPGTLELAAVLGELIAALRAGGPVRLAVRISADQRIMFRSILSAAADRAGIESKFVEQRAANALLSAWSAAIRWKEPRRLPEDAWR